MYFLFLWEVLKRAFTPAPRVTDMLQILAASTLPAVSKFVGIRMPQSASNDALAYIGLVALSFVIIRLFWAPYAMWKDQNAEIGALKLDLSKPQRLVMEHLAKHQAKARAKLVVEVEKLWMLCMLEGPVKQGSKIEGWFFDKAADRSHRIKVLQAEAGLPLIFDTARRLLSGMVLDEGELPNDDLPKPRQSEKVARLMQQYLTGEITEEALARRLPPHIDTKTPP